MDTIRKKKRPSRERMQTYWQLGLRCPPSLKGKITEIGRQRFCPENLKQTIWEPS